jgi:hypothetical protein
MWCAAVVNPEWELVPTLLMMSGVPLLNLEALKGLSHITFYQLRRNNQQDATL